MSLSTFSQFIIIFLVLLNNVVDALFSSLLPLIQVDFNINIQQSEWLFSSSMAGYAFGMLFWGYLTEKIGKKKSWTAGCLLAGLSILLSCHTNNFNHFLVLRFMQGLAVSANSIMCLIMIRDNYHDASHRTQMHAKVNKWMAIAPITSLLLNLSQLENISWRGSYSTIAFIFFIFAFMLQKIPVNGQQKTDHKWIKQIFNILSERQAIQGCLLTGLCISACMTYFSNMPHLINAVTNNETLYQYSLAGLGLSWTLGGLATQKISKIYNQKKAIKYASQFLIFISLLMIANLYTQDNLLKTIILIVLCLISFIATGVIIPNAISWALDKHHYRATVASAVVGFGYYMVSMQAHFLMTLYPNLEQRIPLCFLIASITLYVISLTLNIEYSTETVDKVVDKSN